MEIYVRDNNLIDRNIEYVRKKFVGENSNNYDRNLCNLRVIVDNDRDSKFQYSVERNRIEISKKRIAEMGANVKKTFNYAINHELLHAASSRYDRKRGIVHSGFAKQYFNGERPMNEEDYHLLVEGFVQYLLRNEEYVFKSERYEIYRHIAGMLTDVVGLEENKEIFFNARGTEPVCDILKSNGVDESTSKEFFNKILTLEESIFTGTSVVQIPDIQELLMYFYSKKIESITDRQEAVNLRNSFTKNSDVAIDYLKGFIHKLEPRDSYFGLGRLDSIKTKTKSI